MERSGSLVVAVGGGRVGVNKPLAHAVLRDLLYNCLGEFCLVEGDAVGYDRIAGAWAVGMGLEHHAVAIDNALDGDRDDAPKRRNQRVIDTHHPEIFVAFDGGPGTRDMITRCQKAGVRVFDVESVDYGHYVVWELYTDGRRATLVTEGTYS